jgi:serine/threonine protein kinase
MYLAHPTIVRLVGWNYIANKYNDSMNSSSQCLLILEEMREGSIDKYLKLDDETKVEIPGTVTQRMIFIYGIAHALAWAHSRHIFHRDVKPSNVLLDDALYPRVADFGTSKLCADAQMTEAAGTKKYMPPEVLNCTSEGYSFEADVFSCAITFYEILTGRYWSLGPIDKHRRQVIAGKRPPCDGLVGVTPEFIGLLEQMWAAKPEDRPSFQDVVAKLEQPRFWLKEIKPAEFQKYIDHIAREEAFVQQDIHVEAECTAYLKKMGLIMKVTECLSNMIMNRSMRRDDTERVLPGCALAWLMAESDQEQQEIIDLVEEAFRASSLKDGWFLVPAVLNARANIPRNPA